MYKFATALLALLPAAAVHAEPAWGGNCLACHGSWETATVRVFGEDTMVDPDESATGAPDRGPLKTFQIWRGDAAALEVEVQGLLAGDTFAVQLKRLRFAGVEQGGTLVYGADCDWPEWGDSPQYYTQPAVSYAWGTGPAGLAYQLQTLPQSDNDYYDLVFAVAGAYSDGTLFYGEEHFYVQVRGIVGDLDCNGVVNFADINPFILALSNPAAYAAQFPACSRGLGDCNADGEVGFGDINGFIDVLTGLKGGGP